MLRAALALALLSGPAACKRGGQNANGSTRVPDANTRAAQGAPAGVELPDPLALPASPETLLHVQNPAQSAAYLAAWAPGQSDPNAWLGMELAAFIDPPVADQIAASIDPRGPWDAVEFGDAAVFHLPVVAAALPGLNERLGSFEAAGSFGAVALPSRDAARVLAWARETADGPRLTLARSEAGLVAGVQLASTYGRAPLVAAADVDRLRLAVDPAQVPVTRVSAEGTIENLKVRLELREGEDPFAELELGEGAMSSLLRDPATLAAASSRYTGYKKAVGRTISEIQGQIDDLPFLLKGWATDLASRFNAILRSWDGRLMAGVADGHVRFAYGSDDPKKSGVAVLHFLRGALDGLSLVRNFSNDVPDIRLKKNVARSGNIEVHRLDVRGAKRMARELEPLLDASGVLHVAMAFDARFAGGVVVVGPDAAAQAVKWIEGTQQPVGPIEGAPAAAMHFGLSAQQLASLQTLAQGGELDLQSLWSWKASGPPVHIEVRQVDARHLEVHLRGPSPSKIEPTIMQVALPPNAAEAGAEPAPNGR